MHIKASLEYKKKGAISCYVQLLLLACQVPYKLVAKSSLWLDTSPRCDVLTNFAFHSALEERTIVKIAYYHQEIANPPISSLAAIST